MQDPPGHRLAIHSNVYREVGIGTIHGTNSDGSDTVGPLLITENFGTSKAHDGPFLVGAVYRDLDTNDFYSVGEGVGGVRVTVSDCGYHATSSSAGAYALPLPGDGVYTASFRAPGWHSATQTFTVAVGRNVKLDHHPAALDMEAVDSLALTPSGDAALQIPFDGPGAELLLQFTRDYERWDDQPGVPVAVSNGLFQFDAVVPDDAEGGAWRVLHQPY
jgi:hypothetical protein